MKRAVLLTLLLWMQAPPAEGAPANKPSKTQRNQHWNPVNVVTPRDAAEERVRVRGNEIEYPDRVHFRHGKVDLVDGADAVLGRVAELLLATPEIRLVLIEGHTDRTGSFRYNQRLSEARASAVRAALMRHGVAPERLRAYGLGETRPTTPPDTGRRAKADRRVVFRLIEADRTALQARRASEWGQAAVVGVHGEAQWALVPSEGEPSAWRPLPAGALAQNDVLPVPEPDEEVPVPVEPVATDAPAAVPAAADVAPSEYAPPPEVATGAEPEGAADEPAPDAAAVEATPAAPGHAVEWHTLRFRDQLGEGVEIATGPEATVLLRLPDLTRIQLAPSTRVRLAKIFFNADEAKAYTAVRLRQGRVRVMANPRELAHSRALFAFAGGSVDVVAADFELAAGTGDGAELMVERGRALIATGADTSIEVTAGHRLASGDAAPQVLLAAPAIDDAPEGRHEIAPTLMWSAVTGAAGYVVEFAEDPDFHKAAGSGRREVAGTSAVADGLQPERRYFWRVRARSPAGHVGRASRIFSFDLGAGQSSSAASASSSAATADSQAE